MRSFGIGGHRGVLFDGAGLDESVRRSIFNITRTSSKPHFPSRTGGFASS